MKLLKESTYNKIVDKIDYLYSMISTYEQQITELRFGFQTPSNLKEVGIEKLYARIEEVLHRLRTEPPDSSFRWDMDDYKDWLLEPLLRLDYQHYPGPML